MNEKFNVVAQEKIDTTSAICMKTSTLFVSQAVAFALYETCANIQPACGLQLGSYRFSNLFIATKLEGVGDSFCPIVVGCMSLFIKILL